MWYSPFLLCPVGLLPHPCHTTASRYLASQHWQRCFKWTSKSTLSLLSC
jgi:hypothetical protein